MSLLDDLSNDELRARLVAQGRGPLGVDWLVRNRDDEAVIAVLDDLLGEYQ